MDGELTEAADIVISSSCMQIIGIHFQNPEITEMYIMSVVRFRIALISQPQHELISVFRMTTAISQQSYLFTFEVQYTYGMHLPIKGHMP